MYSCLTAHTSSLRHTDISQHRRESLRPALNRLPCHLYNPTKCKAHFSNEFLFGVDLSKRADEALKAKRLVYKLAGSNVAKREQQGLRLSEPDLYAVPEQEERIPTVPEPTAICIPNRYNGGKRYANGQTGAPAPNTRNSHLLGTPALHY